MRCDVQNTKGKPTHASQEVILSILREAAKKGERCPTLPQLRLAVQCLGFRGIQTTAHLTVLARQGHIRIEVYARNWRVVEIDGHRTAPSPDPYAVPYRVIGADSAFAQNVPLRPVPEKQKASPKPTVWTEERLAQVSELKKKGMTARQVAATIDGNFSRNAVIAAINRNPDKCGPTHNGATAKPFSANPLEARPVKTCQWPIGTPGQNGFRFCGSKHVVPGKSYCSKHCAVAYRAPSVAEKRLEKYG